MKLYKIIEHLYISNFEIARNEIIVKNENISRILSIGCDYVDNNNSQVDNENSSNRTMHYKLTDIEYASYPNILDTPETCLLEILSATNKFIHSSLTENQPILVHCQYGQSRSVAIAMMYFLCTGKYNLEEVMLLFNNNHPNICINPGFLSQIYFLSQAQINSPILKLFNFNSSYDKLFENDQLLQESVMETDTGGIFCKHCKAFLVKRDNIIRTSIKTSEFISKHLDVFWKGYQSLKVNNLPCAGPIIIVPSKNIIVVAPCTWMVHNIFDTTKNNFSVKNAIINTRSLICPHCYVECGYFSEKSLNVIGEYCLADLYALYESSILIRNIKYKTTII